MENPFKAIKHAGETFQVFTDRLANIREHYEIYHDDILDIGCKANNSFAIKEF